MVVETNRLVLESTSKWCRFKDESLWCMKKLVICMKRV